MSPPSPSLSSPKPPPLPLTEELELLRRAWRALSVISNLGVLSYFKYCNFFIANLNALIGWLGWHVPAADILLPAGISFCLALLILLFFAPMNTSPFIYFQR